MAFGNESEFKKVLDAFVRYSRTDDYQEDERGYKKSLIETLGKVLAKDSLAAPSFLDAFRQAVSDRRQTITNLTHFISTDDFVKYLAKVSVKRLRSLMQSLLYGAEDLAPRIDTFKAEVDTDLERFLGKGKRIQLGMISLFLASCYPDRYIFYRAGIIDRACEDWGIAKPQEKTNGDKYIAYLELVKSVWARLATALGRQAELVDVHTLLWVNNNRSQISLEPVGGKGPDPQSSPATGPLKHATSKTRNVILYGPPGTGKTYWTRAFAKEFTGDGKTEFVTFHQSFAVHV
jgi:Cdc6-like AAA superfamily ATPase